MFNSRHILTEVQSPDNSKHVKRSWTVGFFSASMHNDYAGKLASPGNAF